MTDSNENARAEQPPRSLSRRSLLQGTAGTFGAALASPGIYKMIDTIAVPPQRSAVALSPPPQEQYILQNGQTIMVDDSGLQSSKGTIAVSVPRLHDHIITATLNVPANAKALQEAQQHFESVIVDMERQFPLTTTKGVSATVTWGLPYFQHYIPSLGTTSAFFKAGTSYPEYLPVDLMTSKAEGHTVYAVQEAMTFPSDQPPSGFGPVRLEQNDMAVLLRSDSLDNNRAATNVLFGPQAGGLFTVTSIRYGFTAGGFYGQQGLPSKMAVAAHIPGAQYIPPQAQGFLGFTTTLQSNLGPGNIASLETLPGITDQWPNGYFKQGTTMPLSHMFQDVGTWYEKNYPQYADRVQAMLEPGLSPAPGTEALQPPGQTLAQVVHGVQQGHGYGHTGSMSYVDSTTSPITSNYGEAYPTGTTIPIRGDFQTLDNPFKYTSDPTADHYTTQQAAGLHFVEFQPTIGIWNTVRLAMDGHYSDMTLPVSPRSPHAGINSVLHTTHRQNFLVPPRRSRSFPLAEFLA